MRPHSQPNKAPESSLHYDQITEKAFDSRTFLVETVFQEGLEEICGTTFEGCHLLEKLVIPSFPKFVGDNVFDVCQNLRVIQMNREMHIIKINDHTSLCLSPSSHCPPHSP